MPVLSRFFGITIRMYYRDHAPPHFHARYAGREALFGVDGRELLRGSLPRRAVHLVREWATLHHEELMEAWASTQRGEQPNQIAPLE